MEKRDCGTCTICCNIAEVDGGFFYKKPYTNCQYLKKDYTGCSIYEKRPQICRDFKCAWLRGYGDFEDIPNKSGVMVSINNFNGGTWIIVMETIKNAYLTTGKNIILDIVKKVNLPIIVVDFDSKYPNDKGDYVILNKNLENRSKYIMGEYICNYDYDINVYKLIIN